MSDLALSLDQIAGSLPSITEDSTLLINASTLTADYSDVGAGPLFVSTLAANVGQVVDNGDGTFEYQPPQDFNGTVTLIYTLSDGLGTTVSNLTQTFEVTPVNDAPIAAGEGLNAQVFDGTNFDWLVIDRVDSTINFDWGDEGVPETASIRWDGYVVPRYSEEYTFNTLSDEGVRVWVNDELIIDNWTAHPVTWDTGTIVLEAGQPYSITVEYYEDTGYATMQLYWSSASQNLEIVPQARLFTSPDISPLTIVDEVDVGASISANLSALTDADGIGNSDTFAYQWQVSSDGGATWSNIAAATDATYTPDGTVGGDLIRVQFSYLDLGGTLETISSDGSYVNPPTPHANFNADDNSDVVFRMPGTGDIYIGYAPEDLTQTLVLADMVQLISVGPNVIPVGTGDFDGDGTEDDILLYDTATGAIDLVFTGFEGYSFVEGMVGGPAVSLDWEVVGVGNLDGDAYRDDILWVNTNTGEVRSWIMDSGMVVADPVLLNAGTLGATEDLLAVGDFDGDTFSDDLLVIDNQTGVLSVWFYDGTNQTGSAVLDTAPTANLAGLQVAGVADYDGDLIADDVLWQNTLVGINSIWFTEGGTIVETVYADTIDTSIVLTV